MSAWEKDANWMKQQPGFLFTQLHRAIGGSRMFMNHAVWESVDSFRVAFTHPDFVSALARLPVERSRAAAPLRQGHRAQPLRGLMPGAAAVTIMPKRAHLIAGLLAPLCIATFFLSTLLTELFGSHAAVAQLKLLIVTPGLWIMIPLMAAAGASGMFLARARKGRLVDAKKKRMLFIAANGLLVLVPCVIVPSRWASASSFDTSFYVVQAIELIAGATNHHPDGPERARRAAHGRAAAAKAH